MADAITLVVSLIIMYFVLRYLLGGQPAPAATAGTSPRGSTGPIGVGGTVPRSSARARRLHVVSPAQVDAVCGMFPHFPRHVIEADLALTGSVEATCDKILSGALQPPPPDTHHASAAASHPSMSHSTLKLMKLDDDQPIGEAPKNVWEGSKEAREANLRARKEHMVKLARERLKAQQAAKEREAAAAASAGGPSSSAS